MLWKSLDCVTAAFDVGRGQLNLAQTDHHAAFEPDVSHWTKGICYGDGARLHIDIAVFFALGDFVSNNATESKFTIFKSKLFRVWQFDCCGVRNRIDQIKFYVQNWGWRKLIFIWESFIHSDCSWLFVCNAYCFTFKCSYQVIFIAF